MAATRRSAGFFLALLIGLSACGAQDAGSSAAPDAVASDGDPGGDIAALTFTPEADASAQETVTLEDGGTVSATAADGTTFELVVPPDAVPGDTEIILTPLGDLGGMEADALHGVLLEPDGLEFHELVRLTITPAQPIPIENQLMFEAAGDGADPQLALVDPRSESIVILLDHFSVAGIATASEAQRARLLEKSAANAEQRLNGQVRERIGAERYRQLTGGEEVPGSIDRDALSAIAAEFEREVLDKRRQAAAESCRALRAYVRSVISWERQLQLAGMTEAEEAASLARIVEAIAYAESRAEECEKEAVAACQDAEDPQILIDFWLWIDKPVDKARAEKLCMPQDYKIDKTVNFDHPSVSFSVTYTATKCGGPTGEWIIDSDGTLTDHEGEFGGTARVGGPLVVTIPEGALSGTVEGQANMPGIATDEESGRFAGTATFVEEPATLELSITSGTGLRALRYGFLDTGILEPGTLTFALESGDFCEGS